MKETAKLLIILIVHIGRSDLLFCSKENVDHHIDRASSVGTTVELNVTCPYNVTSPRVAMDTELSKYFNATSNSTGKIYLTLKTSMMSVVWRVHGDASVIAFPMGNYTMHIDMYAINLTKTTTSTISVPYTTGDGIQYCSTEVLSEDPGYTCISKSIDDINKQMLTDTNVTRVLANLRNATSSNQTTRTTTLSARDLEVIDTIFLKITDIIDPISPAIVADTDMFLDVANNIIGRNIIPAWKARIQKTQLGADAVLNRIDAFVGKVATANTSAAKNTDFAKSNMYISIKEVQNCSSNIKFPEVSSKSVPIWAAKTGNRVDIVCTEGGRHRAYSAALYRDMSEIMPLASDSISSTHVAINAPIISFAFYPHSMRTFPKGKFVELTFQIFNKTLDVPTCSFWRTSQRDWSTEGCNHTGTDMMTGMVHCQCDHLTNFAVLMSPSENKEHHEALAYISMVGCITSMVFLAITVFVYAIFWRDVASVKSKLLMHLCVTLFLALLLFITGVEQTHHVSLCTGIAVTLHCIFLVVFFLILAKGIHLAHMVLAPLDKRDLSLKLLIMSYVMPLIIVSISMTVSKLQGYGNAKFCWLGVDSGLVFAFIGPVIFIIVVNIAVTIVVLKKLLGTTALKKKTDRERAKASLRSICILLPSLGITWLFGVFSVNKNTVVFQYLFAVCNSLQGLLIFVIHCIMDRKLKDLFRKGLLKWLTDSSSGQELSNLSTVSSQSKDGNAVRN